MGGFQEIPVRDKRIDRLFYLLCIDKVVEVSISLKSITTGKMYYQMYNMRYPFFFDSSEFQSTPVIIDTETDDRNYSYTITVSGIKTDLVRVNASSYILFDSEDKKDSENSYKNYFGCTYMDDGDIESDRVVYRSQMTIKKINNIIRNRLEFGFLKLEPFIEFEDKWNL